MSPHHHPHKYAENCCCNACQPSFGECPCDGCEGLRALAGKPAPKPPTQIAGVIGIDAERIVMNEKPVIDWSKVLHLPPFQMYAAECLRNTSGKNALDHAADFVRLENGGDELLAKYAAWHQEKGYWPNETHLGELKQEV